MRAPNRRYDSYEDSHSESSTVTPCDAPGRAGETVHEYYDDDYYHSDDRYDSQDGGGRRDRSQTRYDHDETPGEEYYSGDDDYQRSDGFLSGNDSAEHQKTDGISV